MSPNRLAAAALAELVGGELASEHERHLRHLHCERPQVDPVELLRRHKGEAQGLTSIRLAASSDALLMQLLLKPPELAVGDVEEVA